MRTPASEIAVTARRISKNYGAVEALRMVTFARPVLTQIKTMIQSLGEEKHSVAAAQ